MPKSLKALQGMLGEYYGIASELALIIGLVAASFAAAQPLLFIAKKFSSYRSERNSRKGLGRLLIQSTPLEIQKYSIKTFESSTIKADDQYYEFFEIARLHRANLRTSIRISFLALGFGLSFLTIAIRFIILMAL